MKNLIQLICILIFLASCSKKGTNLKSFQEINVSKSELPAEYLQVLNKCEDANDCYGDYFFTTTDNKQIGDSTYTFITWVDREEFKIGDKKFYFERNSNREAPPFLLHNSKLYYQINNFNLDYNDPKYVEYGMIDLTEELSK